MLALLLVFAFAADPLDPVVSPVPAGHPCVALGTTDTISVDLADVPLLDVARLVSCALDENLLFQPVTLGAQRVSFLGPRPLDRRALAALWRALLADQGLVEEAHGGFMVVRPAKP